MADGTGKFWSLAPQSMQNAMSAGPEDAGKSRGRQLLEQTGAGLAGAPLTALDTLDQYVTQPVMNGLGAVGSYFSSPVDEAGQSTQDFPANPARALFGAPDATVPQQTQFSGLGYRPAPQTQGGQGQGGGMQEFTLPALGPQPQRPNAPRYASANYGGAINTVASAAPSAPNYEAIQNVPMRQNPVEPDTGAEESYLEALQGLAPEAPDEEARGDRNLISVLGAMAAGSLSGGNSTAGIMAGAASRGAQAFVENSLRDAQEDRQYRADQQRFAQATMQAQEAIDSQKQAYEQAVQDTQFGNEQQRYEAQMRAEEARQQFEASQRAFAGQLAGLQARAAESQARAVNKTLNAQFQRDTAQYRAESQASGYEFNNGRLTATIKNPDGSTTIKTQDMGGGSEDFMKQLQGGLDVATDLEKAGLTDAANTVRSTSGMSLAMQQNDPSMALGVTGFSLAQNPERWLGDEYPDVVEKGRQAAQQQGIMQGSNAYPEFMQDYMRQEFTRRIANNPQMLKAAAENGDPMAQITLQKFTNYGELNGGQ